MSGEARLVSVSPCFSGYSWLGYDKTYYVRLSGYLRLGQVSSGYAR